MTRAQHLLQSGVSWLQEVKLCSSRCTGAVQNMRAQRPPGSKLSLCPQQTSAHRLPPTLATSPLSPLPTYSAPTSSSDPAAVRESPHHWNPNSLTQERQASWARFEDNGGSLASTVAPAPAICVDTVTVRLAFTPFSPLLLPSPSPHTPRLPPSLGWSERPPWNGLWSVSAFLRVSYGFQHVSSLPRQQKEKTHKEKS